MWVVPLTTRGGRSCRDPQAGYKSSRPCSGPAGTGGPIIDPLWGPKSGNGNKEPPAQLLRKRPSDCPAPRTRVSVAVPLSVPFFPRGHRRQFAHLGPWPPGFDPPPRPATLLPFTWAPASTCCLGSQQDPPHQSLPEAFVLQPWPHRTSTRARSLRGGPTTPRAVSSRLGVGLTATNRLDFQPGAIRERPCEGPPAREHQALP